jgi:arylsulfatase A-like enzyme
MQVISTYLSERRESRISVGLDQRKAQSLATTSALLAAIILTIDILAQTPTPAWRAVWAVFGLGLFCGALFGFAVGLAANSLRDGWIGRSGLQALSGVGTAAYLFNALGIIERFERRPLVALFASAACLTAGGLVWLSLYVIRRTTMRVEMRSSSARRSVLATLALLVLCGAVVTLDATLFVGLYQPAHFAMRLVSLLLLLTTAWISLQLLSDSGRGRLFRLCPGRMSLGCLVVGLVGASSTEKPDDFRYFLARPYSRTALVIARAATDLDRDGYSSWLGGGDCAALDASRHPFAHDRGGNDIDEDCYAGDAAPATEPPTRTVRAASAAMPPNIVVISVDTLRPDRMSLYGGPNKTTPVLDEWAKQARRYDRAYTTNTSTAQALPSMLQGKYPGQITWEDVSLTSDHRLLRISEPLRTDELVTRKIRVPAEQTDALPALLREAGYYTAAVLDMGTHDDYYHWCFDPHGQFERYETSYSGGSAWNDDEDTTNRALAVIAQAPAEKPMFLWVHYFGPHLPVVHHAEVPDFGPSTVEQYDHEIAFLDRSLEPLLSTLGEGEKRRPVMIALVADHGEEMIGLSRGHGWTVNEVASRIPMLLHAPGTLPGTSQTPVSLIDIAPTVLAVSGIKPGPLVGRDLRTLPSHPNGNARVLFVTSGPGIEHRHDGLPLTAAVVGPFWKLSLDLHTLDEVLSSIERPDVPMRWNPEAAPYRTLLWNYLTTLPRPPYPQERLSSN